MLGWIWKGWVAIEAGVWVLTCKEREKGCRFILNCRRWFGCGTRFIYWSFPFRYIKSDKAAAWCTAPWRTFMSRSKGESFNGPTRISWGPRHRKRLLAVDRGVIDRGVIGGGGYQPGRKPCRRCTRPFAENMPLPKSNHTVSGKNLIQWSWKWIRHVRIFSSISH